MCEVWADIKNYEGLYQVSNFGKVKNFKTDKILSLRNKRGYLLVALSKDKRKKTHQVHRLVAIAFLPNTESKPTVNHLDENKSNNFVGNLEWATWQENANHGTRSERVSKEHKAHADRNKIFYKPIDQFDLSGSFIKTWESISTAAKEMGVRSASVSRCCRGINKTCSGYLFRYHLSI